MKETPCSEQVQHVQTHRTKRNMFGTSKELGDWGRRCAIIGRKGKKLGKTVDES